MKIILITLIPFLLYSKLSFATNYQKAKDRVFMAIRSKNINQLSEAIEGLREQHIPFGDLRSTRGVSPANFLVLTCDDNNFIKDALTLFLRYKPNLFTSVEYNTSKRSFYRNLLYSCVDRFNLDIFCWIIDKHRVDIPIELIEFLISSAKNKKLNHEQKLILSAMFLRTKLDFNTITEERIISNIYKTAKGIYNDSWLQNLIDRAPDKLVTQLISQALIENNITFLQSTLKILKEKGCRLGPVFQACINYLHQQLPLPALHNFVKSLYGQYFWNNNLWPKMEDIFEYYRLPRDFGKEIL